MSSPDPHGLNSGALETLKRSRLIILRRPGSLYLVYGQRK